MHCLAVLLPILLICLNQDFLCKEAIKLYAKIASSITCEKLKLLLTDIHQESCGYLTELSEINNFKEAFTGIITDINGNPDMRKNALSILARIGNLKSFKNYKAIVKDVMTTTTDFQVVLELTERDCKPSSKDINEFPIPSLVRNLGLDRLIRWAVTPQDNALRTNAAYLLTKAEKQIMERYLEAGPDDPSLKLLEEAL